MTCVIGSIMVSSGFTGFYAKYRENIEMGHVICCIVVLSRFDQFRGKKNMKNADEIFHLSHHGTEPIW